MLRQICQNPNAIVPLGDTEGGEEAVQHTIVGVTRLVKSISVDPKTFTVGTAKWLQHPATSRSGMHGKGRPEREANRGPLRPSSVQEDEPKNQCPVEVPQDTLEGKEPQRWPQKRLGRRLEEVAKAVGGGYCRK